MTTCWPKRDEDGVHVTATGERYIIGECGGPEVVEQARADVAKDLKCAKCDGYQIIALDGEIYNCECQE